MHVDFIPCFNENEVNRSSRPITEFRYLMDLLNADPLAEDGAAVYAALLGRYTAAFNCTSFCDCEFIYIW